MSKSATIATRWATLPRCAELDRPTQGPLNFQGLEPTKSNQISTDGSDRRHSALPTIHHTTGYRHIEPAPTVSIHILSTNGSCETQDQAPTYQQLDPNFYTHSVNTLSILYHLRSPHTPLTVTKCNSSASYQ